MTSILRAGLIAITLSAAFTASYTSAFAWGCTAVSDEGSYGYSINFDSENGARNKALNECAKHTTSDSTCEINDCDEDS